MSRRAAREAERRAAEALAEKQPHPSGVVDFEAHDFGGEFAPDQDFNVGDTQDIWAALTHGQRPDPRRTGELDQFRAGVPEVPAAPRDDASSVSGELLDRVRDAVLRRAPETRPPAAQAFPAPVEWDANAGLTRRQRREQEHADDREDGLPGELFADPRRASTGPQPSGPQALPTGFEGQDYEDDGYYDEPYAPEPTIAIRTAGTDLDPQTFMTNPVGLPQSFAEPTGDDALTFSNPLPIVPADPRDEWPAAQADPAFVEPQLPWDVEPQGYLEHPFGAEPAGPYGDPQAHFQNPQLGPPSEVTDLAGFEALIRKARQQPQEPQQAAPKPSLAWADEEEVQEGFTGLLGRSVQGSHGSPNALILPNDPQPDITQAALSANGDIFITGSMNLSRSLSTTGASSDLYDSPEIDRLYEAAREEPAAGVAPVPAKSAVSGAPHDRRLGKAPRRGSNVLPTVLAIVAGAMAVGVVTLLVGSWVLKLF